MNGNPSLTELDARMTELEIRYAFLSSQLEELNTELTDSNRRLDLLERENRRLRETLERLAPDNIESPDE